MTVVTFRFNLEKREQILSIGCGMSREDFFFFFRRVFLVWEYNRFMNVLYIKLDVHICHQQCC